VSLVKESEKTVQMEKLAKEIEEKEQSLDELRHQAANQKATIAELNVRMEEERKQSKEKLVLLNEAKTELTNQFKALAHDIFEEKGKTFSEQNQIKLDALLNPFRDQLKDFKQKVDDVYVHEAKERASLKQELENLRILNQQINQEAMNLTRALKGDKKTQGKWGELILERVLEQTGLRKGIEYETQSGFRDVENKLLKPDVVIHLPEGKDIIVDSKVSLLDYERYSTSDDEIEQNKALKDHVHRNRPASLSSVSESVLTCPPPWVFMAVRPIPALTQASTARRMSFECISR
jgi:DNA recombination protein RmuC